MRAVTLGARAATPSSSCLWTGITVRTQCVFSSIFKVLVRALCATSLAYLTEPASRTFLLQMIVCLQLHVRGQNPLFTCYKVFWACLMLWPAGAPVLEGVVVLQVAAALKKAQETRGVAGGDVGLGIIAMDSFDDVAAWLKACAAPAARSVLLPRRPCAGFCGERGVPKAVVN